MANDQEYDKKREEQVKDEKDKVDPEATNDEKNKANVATAPEGLENIDVVHKEEKQEAEELASSKAEEESKDEEPKEEKKLLNPVEILPGVWREGLLKDEQIGEEGPAPHTPSPTVSPQPDPLTPETDEKV